MHKRTLLTAFLLSGIMASAWPAIAQEVESTWQQTPGPFGGSFSKVTTDPHTGEVWSVVSGQIYYSKDNGRQWHKTNGSGYYRTSFVFRNDGTVFIDNYRSYDRGETWIQGHLPDSLTVWHLSFDETYNRLHITSPDGVYTSVDDGDSWVISDNSRIINIWPAGAGVLYSGNGGNNFQSKRSTDGGASWQFFGWPSNLHIRDHLTHPDSTTYFLVWDANDQLNKIYRTFDHGESLQAVGPASVCGINSDMRLIGFTQDDELLLTFAGQLFILSTDFNTCSRVFDTQTNDPTSTRSIGAVALSETDEITIFSDVLWVSENKGASWQAIEAEGVVHAIVKLIYDDPNTGLTWANARGTALYSTDNTEEEWIYRGLFREEIKAMVAGKDPGELFAATWKGVFLIEDFGTSRTLVFDRHLSDLVLDEDRGIIYGLSSRYDVYYTEDWGATWHPMKAPYSTSSFFNSLLTIALSPTGYLYLRSREDPPPIPINEFTPELLHGVFRTNDLGVTWEQVDEAPAQYPKGRSQFLFDANGDLWLAQAQDIYLSIDEGVTWDSLYSFSHDVDDLLETPDGSLWVAQGGIVSRSMDRGISWLAEQIDGDPYVMMLGWRSESNELLLGTVLDGVFRRQLDETTRVSLEEVDEVAKTHPPLNVVGYPNPSRGQGALSFSINENSRVQIVLFDVLGRRVNQLFDQQLARGNHSIPFAIGHLPAGTYFYRLQTKSGVAVTTIVLGD